MNLRACMLLSLASCVAAACGDDGGTSTTDASTSGTSTTTASSTSSSTSDASTGTTSSTDAGSSSDSTSESTGGLAPTVELRNDSWRDGQAVQFQGGFIAGECWGSTYVPEPDHYPFTLDGISMFIGGEDMGEEQFEVSVWDVDAQGRPMTQRAAATTTFSGMNMPLDQTTIDLLMLEPQIFDQGEFAVSVCLVAHDGFPAIARDTDGPTEPGRNWIFADIGDGPQWHDAAMLGVDGDWIMRTTILLEG